MAVPTDLQLRRMTPDDIDAGLALCRASRWNQTARDWRQFLDLDTKGALVACRDGRVVGSVATVRYAPGTAWVAMVLVAPEERGRGIGTSLLHEGLALVGDVPVVGLDATPLGRPLYLGLGFRDAWPLQRMQRGVGVAAGAGAADSAAAGDGVRPLREDDWPAVLAIDSAVTGLERGAMLRWLAEGAPAYAWVQEGATTGEVTGFALGRSGHTFEHVGPVVADDRAAAGRLVDAVLRRVPRDRPAVIDAAVPPEGWGDWLESRGFEHQRPFTRMYLGEVPAAGWPPGLFAIIGPEFG